MNSDDSDESQTLPPMWRTDLSGSKSKSILNVTDTMVQYEASMTHSQSTKAQNYKIGTTLQLKVKHYQNRTKWPK